MRVLQAPPPERATAQFFAETASVASSDTVIAVPSAIAKTETIPPSQSALRKEKVSTISAPEQGRMPTAATADQALRQSSRSPARREGSGACEWPQEEQTSPAAW